MSSFGWSAANSLIASRAAYGQRGGNTFWLTKSSDRGATWQFRKEVEVDGVKPTGWGPSLVVDAEGNLYLLYVGSGAANKLMMVTTKDPGKSWSRVGDLGGQTTARRPSLAIGSKNALYILYTEGAERKSACWRNPPANTSWWAGSGSLGSSFRRGPPNSSGRGDRPYRRTERRSSHH